MTTIKDVVTEWLSRNTEFKATIADEAGMIETLSRAQLVVRDGKLVDPLTNIAKETGDFIKANARPFLKVLGTGRYLGRYRDTRTKEDRLQHESETAEVLKQWVEKRGFAFVDDEPLRAWVQIVSKNMVHESDGKGSFVLRALVNGVPTASHKPEDLFGMQLNRFLDKEKTQLNELRIKAKLRDEALSLAGMTLADLADKKKAQAFNEQTLKLVEKEYYSQPTKKRLPNIERGALLEDLQKEIAYGWNLPVDPKTWTLAEKTKLAGFAENYIKEVENHAIDSFNKFAETRPGNFYDKVTESYTGLPKEDAR